MDKKRNQKKKNNKGFSLVELIVVIAIIAVLVAVLAPTLLGNIEKSRESKDMNTLDAVYSAVQTAFGDEAGYSSYSSITGIGDASGATLETIVTTDKNAFAADVKEYVGSITSGTLGSENAKSGHITISIIGKKIRVWVQKDGEEAKTSKLKTADGTQKSFVVE